MQPLDRVKEKRKRRLMLLQALVNIGMPIFAVVYFLYQAPHYGLEHLQPRAASAFLLIIFIALMQIVSFTELHDELEPRGLSIALVAPFLYVGVLALFRAVTLGWYFFEMGAIYTMAITLAFLFLVFVRPLWTGTAFTFTLIEAMGYLAAALAQLIFIGPGIVVAWLYVSLMLADARLLGQSVALRFAVFAVALVQLARHEYIWMNKGSPELKGTRKTS